MVHEFITSIIKSNIPKKTFHQKIVISIRKLKNNSNVTQSGLPYLESYSVDKDKKTQNENSEKAMLTRIQWLSAKDLRASRASSETTCLLLKKTSKKRHRYWTIIEKSCINFVSVFCQFVCDCVYFVY